MIAQPPRHPEHPMLAPYPTKRTPGTRAALSALLVFLCACGADFDGDGIADSRDECPRTPGGLTVDSGGCCAYSRGLALARDAVARDESADVGEIWLLRELNRVVPMPEVMERIERRAPLMKGRHDEWIINPASSGVLLPNPPGRGFTKYMVYSLSVAGAPPELAAEYLRDFWSTDEAGYILTHQLLFLELGLRRGLPVAEELKSRRQVLLDRMTAEQRAEPARFSDLYAERAAFLMIFGNPARAEAQRWLDFILAHQEADGMWRDPHPAAISYDGDSAESVNKPIHTTALAMTAIGFFLHRFAPEEPAGSRKAE